MTNASQLQASLQAEIAAANNNVTHADFVAGVKSGTMGFRCMGCEPHRLIQGGSQIVFGVMVLLYMVAPVVFVPLWAWHEHSWWLLAGIPASVIGTQIASYACHRGKEYSIAAFFLIATIITWLRGGIHSYYTFFTLCALWGMVLFIIAENAEREYAMQSLIDHPEVFEDAITKNAIMITRRSASPPPPT